MAAAATTGARHAVRFDDRGRRPRRGPCGLTTMVKVNGATVGNDDVRIVRGRRRPRRPRDARRPRFRWSPLRSALNDRGLARGFDRRLPAGPGQEGQRLPASGPGEEAGRHAADRGRLRANTLGWPFREWYRDNDDTSIGGTTITSIASTATDGLINALFPYANRRLLLLPGRACSIRSTITTTMCPTSISRFYPDNDDYSIATATARSTRSTANGADPGHRRTAGRRPVGVGQPLPPAYGAYNVPFAYRAQYYDTPDNMVSLQRRLHLSGRSDDPADHRGDQRIV